MRVFGPEVEVKAVNQVSASVISNTVSKVRFGHCVLDVPSIARTAKPGQCIDIRFSDGVDPLLRRPFGVHRVDKGTVSVLYEIVGRGTELFASKRPGESLDIVGPFGTGFDYHRSAAAAVVLVAGGMGVAPLVFLSERLAEKKSKKPVKAMVLIGARDKSGILCEKEFKSFGCDVRIATDDGSKGFKGRVTDLLSTCLPAAADNRSTTIYACGPHRMLCEVGRIASFHSLSAQVSLEAHMSCGIGACLGCVVKTRNGYRRVCKDGPVFNAADIEW